MAPNLNYPIPSVARAWAETRDLDIALATAIHAIADSKRSPEAIYAAPTRAEWNHVKMAVAEYVANGVFAPADDGKYAWGDEVMSFEVPSINDGVFQALPESVDTPLAAIEAIRDTLLDAEACGERLVSVDVRVLRWLCNDAERLNLLVSAKILGKKG